MFQNSRLPLAIAAALLSNLRSFGADAIAPDIRNFMMPQRDYRFRGATRMRLTSKCFPHSSTRQRARYARQIAAGQLKMDGVR